jgi:hypothetical protein
MVWLMYAAAAAGLASFAWLAWDRWCRIEPMDWEEDEPEREANPPGEMSNQWATVQDGPSIWHVIPLCDTRNHQWQECWCNPDVTEKPDGLIYEHNAGDERDQYEQGKRKPH